MDRFSLLAKTTALATTLLVAPMAFAIDVPQGVDSTALVSTSAFITPGLDVTPTQNIFQADALRAANLPNMDAFMEANGSNWEVRWDVRNNRPNLIQGQGIAVLPKDSKAEIKLADVERELRSFMEKNAALLGIEGMDLRLDKDRSISYGGYYWTMEFQQFHQGLPVEDATVFFRINHGNIIQFGVNKIADVTIDTTPNLSGAEALATATDQIGLRTAVAASRGSLKLFPIAAEGDDSYGERFEGAAGYGYSHVLVYEHIFTAKGSDEPFRTLVDAQSGRLLSFRSERVYAQVTANIYPTTTSDPLVNVGLGHANVTNGTVKTTNAAGSYIYTGGTATATLNGKYFKMTDTCGAISFSDSSTGNLAFGGLAATDCVTPGFGGAGNTSASRSGFYHLTNINRKAATFFPSNTWLASLVTANMNINLTCNAFWNGSTLNFYRSGGGCGNTGEIAAVFLHEYGHGMDTNTGGSASEYGSGEAVGDTFAFLETKDGCIGKGFKPGVACANCYSSCTGVRDVSSFATGGNATIASPANVTSNTGINCDRYTCPYLANGVTPYQGPMGYEGHCESYIASSANWDLQKQLNTALGNPAGWTKMDQIWYGSLTPSKSAYQLVSGGKCNAAAVVNGCGSTNWYTVYLSVDDDNGNLADGTPNGCRIWSAFNSHGIACGTQPACSGGSSTTPATGSFLWLKADAGVSVSGSNVTSWADQSGNGNTASMPTTARQPVRSSGALNGKPVISFNGAQSLNLATPISPSSFTIFVVGKNRLSTETFSMILGPGTLNNQLRWENGSSLLFVGTSNSMPATTSSIGNTRVYHQLALSYNGSTMSVYRDGALISTHSFTTTGPWTMSQIGAWFSTYYMVGDVAEILVYNSALSSTNRTQTVNYLRSKYALP